MFTLRFLMFKMRELTHFKPKITEFERFSPQKCIFSLKIACISRKLSIFAHTNNNHKWIIVYY